MFLKLLLLVLTWSSIHANSKFVAQKLIELQKRKQSNIISPRKLQEADQDFDNIVCVDDTCFDVNLPDYTNPIYPVIFIGENSYVPMQVAIDGSNPDVTSTLDQMVICTDDNTCFSPTSKIEFTSQPTSTQICFLQQCYEVVEYDINTLTDNSNTNSNQAVLSVICIGKDCLNAQEISPGQGATTSLTVFWLSGRPFLPNEPVTDGSNSIANFTLSNSTFCFYDDSECYVPFKRIKSAQDGSDDDIVRCWQDYCYICNLKNSTTVQLDVGQIYFCIEDSCLIALKLSFSKGLSSNETVFWIDESPYQAVQALDSLPQPASVVGSLDQTLICPKDNVDCYKLISLSDQSSNDPANNITCWQAYCYKSQIYTEPDFQVSNQNLTVCIDQKCFIGQKQNNSESWNEQKQTQVYIEPYTYLVYDRFSMANIGDVEGSLLNQSGDRIEVWINGTDGYWPIKFINDKNKFKNQIVRCLFQDMCFTADKYNITEHVIQFDDANFQVFVEEVSFQQAYYNSTNDIIIWNNQQPYLFEFMMDGYANQDINFNITDHVVCFRQDGCFQNLYRIDASSNQDDDTVVECFDDAMAFCLTGEPINVNFTIVNVDGLTALTIQKTFLDGLQDDGVVIWSGLIPYSLQYMVNSSLFDVKLNINNITECYYGQYCQYNFKRVFVQNTSTNNDTVSCIQNQCYKFSTSTGNIPLYIYNTTISTCIDNVCFSSLLVTSSTSLKTDNTSIWIKPFNFLVQKQLSQVNNPVINVSLSDYQGQDRVEVFLQGDENAYWPIQFVNNLSNYENQTTACLFKNVCFTADLYDLTEKVLQFDDIQVKVYVQKMNISEAWGSNETIIWNGFVPYLFEDLLDKDQSVDLNLNTSDVTICFGQDGCYSGLSRVNSSLSTNQTSYECLDDAQTVCFTGVVMQVNLQILYVDGFTYLAEQLSFEVGYVSNDTIIWDGYTPYKIDQIIPNNDFYTVELNLSLIVECWFGQVCFTNISRVPVESSSNNSTIPCQGNDCYKITLTNNSILCVGDVCYTADIYNGTETIIQVNDGSDQYTGFAYFIDNQTTQDFNNSQLIWINQEAYYPVFSVSNDMSPDVIADVSDIQVSVNGQFYNNAQRLDQQQDLQSNQIQQCYNETKCFSLDLIQSQDQNITKQVISFNDIEVFVLVQKIKISQAWGSSQTIIWKGIVPYLFEDLLDKDQSVDLNLNTSDVTICFGQDGCYSGLSRVNSSLSTNQTSYECLDDAQSVCFTGVLMQVNLQILYVDGFTYLAEQLSFEVGYVSNDTIIWDGYTPYKIDQIIPNNDFYTVELNLSLIVECWFGQVCFTNISRVPIESSLNNSTIPCQGDDCYKITLTNNSILCVGDVCYTADIYNGTETIIQVNDGSDQYTGFAYFIDNQTTQDFYYSQLIWIDQEAYYPVFSVSNDMSPDVIADVSDIQVSVNGQFYNNAQKLYQQQDLQSNQIQQCYNETGCFSLDLIQSQDQNITEPLNPCDPLSYSGQSAYFGGKYELNVLGAQKDCYVNESGSDADTYENTTTNYDAEFKLAEDSNIGFAQDFQNQEIKIRANFRDYFFYAITGAVLDPSQAGKCASECSQSADHCCASIIARQPETGLTITDSLCMNQRVAMTQLTITLASTTYKLKCGSNPDGYVSSAFAVQATAFLVSTLALVQSII